MTDDLVARSLLERIDALLKMWTGNEGYAERAAGLLAEAAQALAAFYDECDKVHIPYDAAGLVRHHRNNAEFAAGAWKDAAERWRERAERAEARVVEQAQEIEAANRRVRSVENAIEVRAIAATERAQRAEKRIAELGGECVTCGGPDLWLASGERCDHAMSDYIYLEFAETIAVYMRALTAAQESIDEKEGLTPYLGRVEVKLDGTVVGYLVDEDGIGFHYESAPIPEESA